MRTTSTTTSASAPPPLARQRAFWNAWNASARESGVPEVSARQAREVEGWLERIGRRDLAILEAGCGAGWLCPRLARYGAVTGTDLSDEVLARARARHPGVAFVAGDFMEIPFPREGYDVVVTLEVLSHVADQAAFLARIADLLKPGGRLMLATQNRPVLERFNRLPPPAAGQIRRWVDARELAALLAPRFEIVALFSATPRADHGLMRLVHSATLNRPIRALFGDSLDRLKERMGLGWTLMALARKRDGEASDLPA